MDNKLVEALTEIATNCSSKETALFAQQALSEHSNNLEKTLCHFLRHIMEVHTDKYGMLEISSGNDPKEPTTVENVVKDYLSSNGFTSN